VTEVGLISGSLTGTAASALLLLGTEGKMAAAENDRDAPSALCSEFLNFSAKDTAAVGDSFIKTLQMPYPDELYIFVG